MTVLKIAIAFPIADAQRELLRRIIPEQPIPALYRTGAENRPCASCGMTLNVGPRVLTAGAPIYCVICGTGIIAANQAEGTHIAYWDAKGPRFDVEDLGNPESISELDQLRQQLQDEQARVEALLDIIHDVDNAFGDVGGTLQERIDKVLNMDRIEKALKPS
jgi:hypothetical protein